MHMHSLFTTGTDIRLSHPALTRILLLNCILHRFVLFMHEDSMLPWKQVPWQLPCITKDCGCFMLPQLCCCCALLVLLHGRLWLCGPLATGSGVSVASKHDLSPHVSFSILILQVCLLASAIIGPRLAQPCSGLLGFVLFLASAPCGILEDGMPFDLTSVQSLALAAKRTLAVQAGLAHFISGRAPLLLISPS